MDHVRAKCLCERNRKGQIVKRNDACPVRHRGTVGTYAGPPVKRKTMSDAQMAIASVRDELRSFDNRLWKCGLEGIREILWPHLAAVRLGVETIRRYLDGE